MKLFSFLVPPNLEPNVRMVNNREVWSINTGQKPVAETKAFKAKLEKLIAESHEKRLAARAAKTSKNSL